MATPDPDPSTSAAGRAILQQAVGTGEPVQQQSDVWSATRLANELAAWADRADEIAIQTGYQVLAADDAGNPAAARIWRRRGGELAGCASIARNWVADTRASHLDKDPGA